MAENNAQHEMDDGGNQHNQTPPPANEAATGNNAPINEINAASTVRLPWPAIVRDNIELWFLQIDHWFTVNRITSDNTRFSTVVAALDFNLLQQVYETVRNPPATGKYQALKAAVIRNFTESEQRRAQQFVSGLQLGDKKPSHLLNDLRRIGGENQDEKFLKVLWLNRLPIQVQTCLAASTSPLNDLAQLADSVMETFRVSESFNLNAVQTDVAQSSTSSSNISAASSSSIVTTKNSDNDILSKLAIQVEKLTRQIARMHDENSSSHRSRSNARSASQLRSRSSGRQSSRQRNRSATPTSEDDDQCWYHRTYGNDARKCRDPCEFPKN